MDAVYQRGFVTFRLDQSAQRRDAEVVGAAEQDAQWF
jgi:hypothetical protein